MKPIIWMGEKVFKKNGTLLGHFTQDLYPYTRIEPHHFLYANGTHPKAYNEIDRDIVLFMRKRLEPS